MFGLDFRRSSTPENSVADLNAMLAGFEPCRALGLLVAEGTEHVEGSQVGSEIGRAHV